MKILKCDLPDNFKVIELHSFADEHIGDPLCKMDKLIERINYVKNTPNAYCILNGDLMDNAILSSVGDTYEATMTPKKQLETLEKLFKPISHKILCITQGNHENRTYKDTGMSLSAILACMLNLQNKYVAEGVVLFIRFGRNVKGRKECYTVYVTHGRGGGRREGSKANRLADMASIVDADIYIHAHTHLPMIMKTGYYRICYQNSSIALVTKLFVNTASNLDYGGYGQVGEFKPNSIQSPVVYLKSNKHEAYAKL